MKILIVSQEFPPKIGGAGTIAEQNASELSGRGHEVTVVTKMSKDIDTHLSCSYHKIYVREWPKLWPICYRMRIAPNLYDCILLNDLPSLIYGGIFLSKEKWRRTICFLHGSEPETIFQNLQISRRLLGYKYFFCRAMKHCRLIIVPSNYMKDKLINISQGQIDESKVQVHYAGINDSLFGGAETYAARTSKQVRIISASRIDKRKGYIRMYNIFKTLCTQKGPDEDYIWTVVGDGPYLKKFQELVYQEGFAPYIKFTGRLSRQETSDLYRKQDIFWLLSDYDEALGLVYLEAQACGLPVIANNRGGTSEAIIDKVTGYITCTDKDVIQIIKMRAWSSLDKTNIVSFAKQFMLSTSINKLEKLLC
ncbi:MAG: glycosyltransferase family 4 protein [Alphaproteobacteria bacterium]